MADKKISELTPKAAQLQDDDLLMVSDYNGATYDTKSVTGANIRPFKTVMFTISQTGTSAPTVDYSYTDEVTQTFTFARTAVGDYTLTASSAFFTANKTFVNLNLGVNTPSGSIGYYRVSTTQIVIFTTNLSTGFFADALLDKSQLEIKIIK